MQRRPRTLASAAVVLIAVSAAALAGCGGSSSSSSPPTSSTTTPTTTTSSTTKGGSGTRLSATQWQVYETKNATFVSVTNKGIAKFRSCGTVAGRTTNAQQYVNCMGDTVTTAITATTDLGTTLHGYHPQDSSQCAAALNAYIGVLYQWRSTLQTVQSSLSSAAPQSSGAASNARTQYPQIQSSATTFAKECKPVGA
jgi:hypothetical protein